MTPFGHSRLGSVMASRRVILLLVVSAFISSSSIRMSPSKKPAWKWRGKVYYWRTSLSICVIPEWIISYWQGWAKKWTEGGGERKWKEEQEQEQEEQQNYNNHNDKGTWTRQKKTRTRARMRRKTDNGDNIMNTRPHYKPDFSSARLSKSSSRKSKKSYSRKPTCINLSWIERYCGIEKTSQPFNWRCG